MFVVCINICPLRITSGCTYSLLGCVSLYWLCISGYWYFGSLFLAKEIQVWSHHTREPFPPCLLSLQMGFHSFFVFFPPLTAFFPNSSINPSIVECLGWERLLRSELWIPESLMVSCLFLWLIPLFTQSLTRSGKVQGRINTYARHCMACHKTAVVINKGWTIFFYYVKYALHKIHSEHCPLDLKVLLPPRYTSCQTTRGSVSTPQHALSVPMAKTHKPDRCFLHTAVWLGCGEPFDLPRIAPLRESAGLQPNYSAGRWGNCSLMHLYTKEKAQFEPPCKSNHHAHTIKDIVWLRNSTCTYFYT